MTDKAGKLLEICTRLIETAAVLEITDLQLDTVKNSARVGDWRDGYAFTGYGTVTLKVTFAPPEAMRELEKERERAQWARVKEVADNMARSIEIEGIADETNRIEAANTTKGQATEA